MCNTRLPFLLTSSSLVHNIIYTIYNSLTIYYKDAYNDILFIYIDRYVYTYRRPYSLEFCTSSGTSGKIKAELKRTKFQAQALRYNFREIREGQK